MRLHFTAVGVPQPKGSTRAFVPKGWTRPIVTSDNAKNKSWQQIVAETASVAIAADRRFQIIDGPARLIVVFYLPRPKSLPKKVLEHTKKPDLDKLVRSAKDAMTKVVWRDDSQVIEIVASKRYAGVTEAPRAEITVESIEAASLLSA